MRDDQRRAARGHGAQSLADFAFGAAVERAGRLIENENAGILQNRSRNGHALLFAAGQFQATLANARVVAVGHAEDEIMHLRQTRGILDLLLGGARAPVGDVVADGVVEQHGVLRHDTDGGAQAGLGVVAHVVAVDDDAAFAHVIEAEQQAGERGFSGAGRPDDGDLVAGGHGEIDALEDFAFRLVAEMHVLEGDGAWRIVGQFRCKLDRIRRVLHLFVDGEQTEHLLHVHDALLDGVVGEPEEVQGLVELDEVGVGEHELADAHLARHHAARGEQHDGGETAGDDRRLAQVQHVQRDLAFYRGAFVGGERFVEAVRLVPFVAEIFDRFVVQQTVDCLGLRLGVVVVHAATETDAPGGEREGEADIGGDRGERYQRETPVEQAPQYDGDQQQLDNGRDDVEDGETEDGFDAGAAAFDGARDAAGLAVEMEAQGEPVHVLEGLQSDPADGALLHGGEHRIAQFAEAGRGEADQAVADDQADRHRKHVRLGAFVREHVDGAGVEDRHIDVGDLGREQEQHGHDHAQAGAGIVLRPEIRGQG